VLPPASRRRAAAPRTQIFGPPAFDGAAAIDNQPWAGFTPPDPTGSIGPSAYVEIVNSMIAAYDPSDGHTLMAPQDLQSFFIANGLALDPGVDHNNAGDSIFDVQVQWDSASNRWLIATDDEEASGTSPNHLVFGWSKSDDPTGAWCIYRTEPGRASFDDFPKLGHDGTHLMIGTNEFANNSEASSFLGAKLWTVATPPAGTITSTALSFTDSGSSSSSRSLAVLTGTRERIFTVRFSR